MRKITTFFVVCLLLTRNSSGPVAATLHKVAIAVQVNTSVGRSLGKRLGRVLVETMEVIATK